MFQHFKGFAVACVGDVRPGAQINKVPDPVHTCSPFYFGLYKLLFVFVVFKQIKRLFFRALQSFKPEL
jgi:hypothetical protein